jgi:phenylalanine-4-hydroxylase
MQARGTEALHSSIIDTEEAAAALDYATKSVTDPSHAIDVNRLAIAQHVERYSEENQEVWRTIVQKRITHLLDEGAGSRVFLAGVNTIDLPMDHIPSLRRLNARLYPSTEWSSFAVPGYLPAKAFFACLAERLFPTTITVRPKTAMNYLPEPDIIHDVFGHVPLHADAAFADFLQTWGRTALKTDDPVHTERLSRLFWFTVEFGLIREEGRLRLYGSGLISSEGEGRRALEAKEVERRPFSLEAVCNTPFDIDRYQPILYVLDSFEQLRDAMWSYEQLLLDEGRAPATRTARL